MNKNIRMEDLPIYEIEVDEEGNAVNKELKTDKKDEPKLADQLDKGTTENEKKKGDLEN